MFCLLTVYLVVSSLYRSDDSISHAGVTCQVRLLCYVLLYAVRVLFEFAIDTSRHRGVQRNDKITCALGCAT